jgi:acetoin utilization protein AcuC
MTEPTTSHITDSSPEELAPQVGEPALPVEVPAEEPQPEAPASEVRSRSSVTLVWTDDLWRGQGHPDGMRSGALLRGYRLLDAVGALRWREVQVIEPDPALGSRDALATFHHDDYLQTVAALNDGTTNLLSSSTFGFHEVENAPFPEMAPSAARYVAAARTAVRQVVSGAATAAFSLAGRQQHARPAEAQGDHIFNDVLLALQEAVASGQKVAFVSLEAERPVVVEQAFADNPSVLLVSLHEDPFFIYPGPDAGVQGKAVANVSLPPGAGDAEFMAAFEQVAAPLFAAFAPDLTVVLVGGSAHSSESLSHLRLTTQGYEALLGRLNALSPRIVLLGGEGTDMDALARIWTIALATLAGRQAALPQSLPAAYARSWGEGTLHDAPPRRLPVEMREYIAGSTQHAIMQAQRLLFPQWGLPVPGGAAESAWGAMPEPARPRAPEPQSFAPREVKVRRKSADEVRAALRVEPERTPDEDDAAGAAPAAEERRDRPRGPRRPSGQRREQRDGGEQARPRPENDRRAAKPPQSPDEPGRRASGQGEARRRRGRRRGGNKG